MSIPGDLLTTAMGVMPHTDVQRALELAMNVDIPYWPQLPRYSYYEDMYVQASEHFPGIVVDFDRRVVLHSAEKFMSELEYALAHMDDPAFMDVSPKFSEIYQIFLQMDLNEFPAIRGQLEGPVSLGFNVVDDNDRPIIFDDTVRPFLLDFLAKRVNIQLARLKEKNPNAFMFVDEPGMQFIFSAMSGYGDQAAKRDLEYFFSKIDRPRGIHLCGNPDWDFMLNLDLDVLSLDVYTNGEIFVRYAPAIKRFLERGGVIVWGVVPTNFEPFLQETVDTLEKGLEGMWSFLEEKGISKDLIIRQGLISPATCCLVNPDIEKTVEKAFGVLKELSGRMRGKYGL